MTFEHHPVFGKFARWSGTVPAGYDADFLGTRYPTSYFSMAAPQPADRSGTIPYPQFDENYFEWIDLLEAVASANGHFTMIDLGAGYGCWTARGAAAAKQRGLPYTLVAAEAEPTHFEWLTQHLQDNGVDQSDCRTLKVAVTSRDGTVGFTVGNPADWYGQAIGGDTIVEAVSLNTLLAPFEVVDFVDLDVQGAEFDILAAAPQQLQHKVRRVHVETHSDMLHESIYRLFRGMGWKLHFNYSGNARDLTPWGRISFQSGLQSWLNPRLHSKSVLRESQTLQNTRGFRLLRLCRGIAATLAPAGTRRRRFIKSRLRWVVSAYRRDDADVATRDRF